MRAVGSIPTWEFMTVCEQTLLRFSILLLVCPSSFLLWLCRSHWSTLSKLWSIGSLDLKILRSWVHSSNETYGIVRGSPYLGALESETPKKHVLFTVRRSMPSLWHGREGPGGDMMVVQPLEMKYQRSWQAYEAEMCLLTVSGKQDNRRDGLHIF